MRNRVLLRRGSESPSLNYFFEELFSVYFVKSCLLKRSSHGLIQSHVELSLCLLYCFHYVLFVLGKDGRCRSRPGHCGDFSLMDSSK